MFEGLDHLAIVVRDTREALQVWRDRFGFRVVFSAVIDNGALRVTHLDMGNTQLQLVQPLAKDHPLKQWLDANGPGLHHFCMKVDSLSSVADEMHGNGLESGEPRPHEGTQGRQALFLDRASTGGVQVEITGRAVVPVATGTKRVE